MMDEREYRDVDGNRCSLDELCRREPAWAANRVRVTEARVRELEAQLREAGEFAERKAERVHALEAQLARLDRLRAPGVR
jgi:hypothetical protein